MKALNEIKTACEQTAEKLLNTHDGNYRANVDLAFVLQKTAKQIDKYNNPDAPEKPLQIYFDPPFKAADL